MEGILIVDKPKGMTSHDVVDFVRKRFNIKKCGHAGTLDPCATGVLVVLIGKATKLSQELTLADKEYIVSIKFGTKTNTQDSEGIVLERQENFLIDKERLLSILESFKGKISQVPPMYSAIKYKGRKLYEIAREGKEVPRRARTVHIYNLEVLEFFKDKIKARVRCSKGTYIRTLCEDIGKKLGIPSHQENLVRFSSGTFTLQQALSIEELEKMDRSDIEKRLIKTGYR